MADDFIGDIVKRRGGGSPPASDAPKGPGYGSVKSDALSTLARILRVTKEDRGEFDAALADYVEACMEDEEKESPSDEAAELEGDETETPEE